MDTICLVTTGQPASNPRLVKEADLLAEAGFRVHVVGVHWAAWADRAEATSRRRRCWTAELIEWRRGPRPLRFWTSRVRHAAAKRALGWPGLASWALPAAVSRLTPELISVTHRVPAALYIAHNLGALPAAVSAARRHGVMAAFDAEDFHSGEFASTERSSHRRAVELAERRFIPECRYVTAASPGIAEAYAPLVRQGGPICVLNVFPLDQRPSGVETRTPRRVQLYWFSQTIGPDRGLEDAVEAMGALDDDVELHLRGTWQEGFRASLLRLAQRSGLKAERIIHHEPGPPEEMVRLAASHDVGLALEPGETRNSDILLSNKIFTYLPAGLAVIATATRGQSPLIDEMPDAIAGYRPRDVASLVGLLRAWVRNRQALDAARARAWHYGETRYNWDLEKTRLLDAVTAVVPLPVPAIAASDRTRVPAPTGTAG